MSSLLPSTLFPRPSWSEVSRVTAVLRRETVGGALLLVATVIALVLANSPWADGYFAVRDLEFGPQLLHLHLSMGEWAADGLLAIFFFVAGLELKREFVAGDLRDPRRAALPVAAALGGIALPALIFVAINLNSPGAVRGWAIPTATDIAFALAVLAVISTHLPAALRMFLLTLAVVDDLLAITIIALFYTQDLELLYLLLALVPLGLFGLLVQRLRGRGGCWCRWPSRPGGWCTPPVCTPPSPGCCWPSRFRCGPDGLTARTRKARAWPSVSSTDFGRCRQRWRCRSSPSSPPGSRSEA